jgi:hypothetical protein
MAAWEFNRLQRPGQNAEYKSNRIINMTNTYLGRKLFLTIFKSVIVLNKYEHYVE